MPKFEQPPAGSAEVNGSEQEQNESAAEAKKAFEAALEQGYTAWHAFADKRKAESLPDDQATQSSEFKAFESARDAARAARDAYMRAETNAVLTRAPWVTSQDAERFAEKKIFEILDGRGMH